MSGDPKQLARLRQLAEMVLQADLATLRARARARDASRAALAALSRRPEIPTGMSPMAAGLATVGYQRWADGRRAEVNTRLAKQTAEWMEARDRAARAFGRAEALGRLTEAAMKVQIRPD